ncbi:hypothetical protein PAXINDRAFT_164840, partial [Paxillus involutus ATCC 200175]
KRDRSLYAIFKSLSRNDLGAFWTLGALRLLAVRPTCSFFDDDDRRGDVSFREDSEERLGRVGWLAGSSVGKGGASDRP